MKIKNHNNGRWGQIIHQEALTNKKTSPVIELAECVHHILRNGGSKNNSIVVIYTNGKKSVIHPLHISRTVKISVCALRLEKQGIMVHMIYTHSL